MLIKIRPTTGNKNILELDASNCINIIDIKHKIVTLWTDLEIEQLKLIFTGRMLQNNETIENHKITNGCTIHCLISEKNQHTLESRSIYEEMQTSEMMQMIQNPEMMQQIMQNPEILQNMQEIIMQNPEMIQNPEMLQNMQEMIQNPEMMHNLYQSDSDNQNHELENDDSINYNELYNNQLENLVQLGFTNIDQNIQILKSCDGNVDTAANILLEN